MGCRPKMAPCAEFKTPYRPRLSPVDSVIDTHIRIEQAMERGSWMIRPGMGSHSMYYYTYCQSLLSSANAIKTASSVLIVRLP